MEFYGSTDIGNLRHNNEDYYHASTNLFIVADGMGGHQAGEIASKMATETFRDTFQQYLDKSNQREKIKDYIRWSIEKANTKVFRASLSDARYTGMGTTLTTCYIKGDNAHIGHVGDSRLYLKRGGKLELKTEDHTMVWEMYENGKISYEQTFSHPQNNILTNVIGTSENIRIDVFKIPVKKDDVIILCSDGLNSMLQDKLINKLADIKMPPKQIADKLIKYAKQKGGHDNITLIVIKI